MDVFKNKTLSKTTFKNNTDMKTKILSLTTIAAIVLGIGTSAFAADSNATAKKHEMSTVIDKVSAISKIEVHGNVELYVSNGETDQVKVYNNYYGENALVQNDNGVLRIASYTNKKLVVWVKAADLRSVTAYDNSV